jgi:hypothetical protein
MTCFYQIFPMGKPQNSGDCKTCIENEDNKKCPGYKEIQTLEIEPELEPVNEPKS